MPSSPATARCRRRSSRRNGDMVRLAPGPADDHRRGAGRPAGRATAKACCRSAAPRCAAPAHACSTARRVATLVLDGRGRLAAPPQGQRARRRGRGCARARRRPSRDGLQETLAELSAAERRDDGRSREAARHGGAPRPAGALRQAAADRNPSSSASEGRGVAHDRPAQPCRDRRAGSGRPRRSIATRWAPGCPRRRRCRRMASRWSSSNCPTPRSNCWSRWARRRRSRLSRRNPPAACTISATRSRTSSPRATG